jgi:orotate phosphoribosyltransferase
MIDASIDAGAAKIRLIELITARSFSAGAETRLVSGRSTNFYFNMKPSMLHPESAHLIATLMLEELKGRHVDYVGGLEIGAVPLATALAVLSQGQGRPIRAFFVRKQAKEHGARKLVEGLAPDETLQGKRVVILEDVTTTGGSSMRAIDAVRAQGGIIAGVITVVDRLEGAAEAFKVAAIPFHALLTVADFRAPRAPDARLPLAQA